MLTNRRTRVGDEETHRILCRNGMHEEKVDPTGNAHLARDRLDVSKRSRRAI